MSLTGGLDTRMIMAWQRSSPGSLPCYTFGGMYRDCQDVSSCPSGGQSLRPALSGYNGVGQEFLKQFPHYAERTVYLSDGCAECEMCF